ncbi:Cof-type HAD-IIB family hydrolase [Mycoplasmopsis columbinasalis]|uniref:Haloacid dehalogenase-like hydrolase n=1 Tax=Mycoplasmopsis columbinasalis TaxID=114880 RepID=A0A449BAP6_9BACT|nr:Cof-type HAD-IIB family hydrolase [Mycoplasmopsis columbinasalis]VEU78274.1 haloacid dehalogenase-like hydrolase [Mycoplasmopsis columbinasalis]
MAKLPIVFSDVDGTIYERDAYVSNFNLSVIKQDNLSFNIATGNPICPRMLKLAKLTNADYIIGSSGVQIYDYQNKKFVYEKYLNPEIVQEIFDLIKKYNVSAAAWSSEVFYVFREQDKEFLNKLYFRAENFDWATIYDPNQPLKPIAKIEVYFEDTNNVDLLIEELKKVEVKTIITHMNVEIISFQASKGRGIYWLLENIFQGTSPDEVMVVGDSENDFSMFKRFYHSYVMDNAKEEVKERANNVTKTVTEHGLGYAILDYIAKLNGNLE